MRGIQGRGWLRDLGTIGRGGKAYWVAPEVLEVIADVSVKGEQPFERTPASSPTPGTDAAGQ